MTQLSPSIIAEWQKRYPDFTVITKLKSGKEADVWLVNVHNSVCAFKVYADVALRTRQTYDEGRWIREQSLRKAVRQGTTVGKSLQRKLWTKREYYLLKKLHTQGAAVPEVIGYSERAILMQYIGDASGPAPRLIDVQLSGAAKDMAYERIKDSLKLLLDNGIVHADLSAYNILWWQDKPWIIDFPQATDVRHNPHWQDLYERDLRNIDTYFKS